MAFRLAKMRLPKAWPAAVLVAMLVAVEAIGRQTKSDLHDGIVLTLVVTALVAARLWWGPTALVWAHPVIGAAKRTIAQLKALRFEIGLDLRQDPPLMQRCPQVLEGLLTTLGSITALLAGVTLLPPVPYREVATRIFYLGHLAFLGLLWSGLLCAVAGSILLTAACVKPIVSRRSGHQARRWLLVIPWFAMVALAGVLLPVWIPVVLLGTALLVLYSALGRRALPPIALLWRTTSSESVYGVAWQGYQLRCAVIAALALLILWLLALGSATLGMPNQFSMPDMPVTTTLGTIAAWLGSTSLVLAAIIVQRWIRQQRRHDPARPCKPSIHLAGKPTDLPIAAGMLDRLGWSTRIEPEPADPSDVRIQLVDTMPALHGKAHWPLLVSLRALELPELQHLLARRDEIQRRRGLVRGFDRLLKSVSRRHGGRGLWIAPHYWYVAGMSRDSDEEVEVSLAAFASNPVGPLFHQAFTRTARNHLYRLLRGSAIDVILVEHGVSHRRFRHVLRALFEHFDIRGVTPIEDRHFAGLPGLRAIVHSHELGKPALRLRYSEPTYEPLARARILHVFRDRGEHEADVRDPSSTRDAPIPLGV